MKGSKIRQRQLAAVPIDYTDTMYMALKAGEISMVYFYAGGIDAGVAADLKEAGNITLMAVKDTSNPLALVFNNTQEPVGNLEVRKAIAKGD